MDFLKITKSKTREKILKLFLKNPDEFFYLRQISRLLSCSAGNIKREIIVLTKLRLLNIQQNGRLVYYKINTDSPLFQIINIILKNPRMTDIEETANIWVSAKNPVALDEQIYCPTRNIFSARLESSVTRLEKVLNSDAYLLTAVIGEIGNNSFDHNLGSWPDVPGTFFAIDINSDKIVLADRGQGIMATLKRVYPDIKNNKEALKTAFTKTVSGRFPEKRGNGDCREKGQAAPVQAH